MFFFLLVLDEGRLVLSPLCVCVRACVRACAGVRACVYCLLISKEVNFKAGVSLQV